MYTKTTAACSEIGKHIIQKNFWTLHLGLPFFPFPSWTSDWNTFTPALSISLQWIAYLLSLNQKCRYCSGKNSQTDVCGTSANPCLYSDHSWQHHSFFKSLAINVAWNCDVFFFHPQWNKCLKISDCESRQTHYPENDWQASWHIVASTFHSNSAECGGHFLWWYRYNPLLCFDI